MFFLYTPQDEVDANKRALSVERVLAPLKSTQRILNPMCAYHSYSLQQQFSIFYRPGHRQSFKQTDSCQNTGINAGWVS